MSQALLDALKAQIGNVDGWQTLDVAPLEECSQYARRDVEVQAALYPNRVQIVNRDGLTWLAYKPREPQSEVSMQQRVPQNFTPVPETAKADLIKIFEDIAKRVDSDPDSAKRLAQLNADHIRKYWPDGSVVALVVPAKPVGDAAD